MSSNYIPEASYDKYAGSATSIETYIYYDYDDVISVDVNEYAINNSIKNILLTRIGSLPGKPDFGSNVMSIVFDLMSGNNTVDILKNSIIRALIKWEPRITILDVNIIQIPEYNKMNANISYSYSLFGSNMSATVSIALHD